MLQVMLCGAADTHRVADRFVDVIAGYGGEPWHYQSGNVLHINSTASGWERNSQVTVHRADLLVFVIVESYGEITWGTEFGQALVDGKPFLVLCLDTTYQRYLTLARHVRDAAAISDQGERNLVAVMRELETEYELTVVPFKDGYFQDILRRQLAALFSQSLHLLEQRNQRESLVPLLRDPKSLSGSDLSLAAEVAIDELEEKAIRKLAIHALASRDGTDAATVLALLSSPEQGVQRLAADRLESLYRVRPPDAEFVEQCVAVANTSDDVGVPRRLVFALFALDPETALKGIDGLDLDEVGIRRRVALTLETHESTIIKLGLAPLALALAARCEGAPEAAWRARLRSLISRLGGVDPERSSGSEASGSSP